MSRPAMRGSASTIARAVVRWATVTTTLHLIWEVAQLPLYEMWTRQPASYVAFAVLHCTLGDVAVSAAIYAAVAVAARDPRWIATGRPTVMCGAVLMGVSYTVWSEWRNVHVLNNWAYGPWMPLLRGIGLSPLLQWLVVPPLSWKLIGRRLARR